MIGTLINTSTVVAGTFLGRVAGHRLTEAMRKSITDGLGLFTLALGVSGAITGFESGHLERTVIVAVGLIIGGLLGTAMNIEGGIERLGEILKKRLGSTESHFVEGFLDASLLFCVGPLAILGAIADGLHGDIRLLVIKAVLDGFAAIFLTSAFGLGVGASALSVLVYQGALTLSAGAIRDTFTPEVLASVDAVGGLLIIGIGLRLLNIRDVKIGNYLPALVLVPAMTGLFIYLR